METIPETMTNESRVKHPSHYAFPNGLEAIDIARHLNFNLGNVVKYVCRAGRKSEEGMTNKEKQVEDLQKALFYLQDELQRIDYGYNKFDR